MAGWPNGNSTALAIAQKVSFSQDSSLSPKSPVGPPSASHSLELITISWYISDRWVWVSRGVGGEVGISDKSENKPGIPHSETM